MTVTATQLRSWVNAQGQAAAQEDLQACVDQATALVTKYVEDNCGDPIYWPDPSIRDRATLEVAADLWNRKSAPNGIVNQQFNIGTGDLGSTPIRISRDPLAAARPILAPWVTPLGFA